MNFKKTMFRSTVISAIGVAGTAALMPSTAAAVIIADGNYLMVINATPVVASAYDFGTDGAWNSGFVSGGMPGIGVTSGMTDNGGCVTGSDTVCRGSSIGGDGFAGRIGLTVSGSGFSITSFSVDTIFDTPAGSFAQYGTLSGSGSVNQTTGALSFTPTGRLAAISSLGLFDRKWNVDDFAVPGATVWQSFTTGSATDGVNTINGAPLVSLGDVNGDGLADYRAILVSGGHWGSDFGCCFGASYFETWNVDLLSQVAVPIPAAAWLFGSGVLGLATLARRKRH